MRRKIRRSLRPSSPVHRRVFRPRVGTETRTRLVLTELVMEQAVRPEGRPRKASRSATEAAS